MKIVTYGLVGMALTVISTQQAFAPPPDPEAPPDIRVPFRPDTDCLERISPSTDPPVDRIVCTEVVVRSISSRPSGPPPDAKELSVLRESLELDGGQSREAMQ